VTISRGVVEEREFNNDEANDLKAHDNAQQRELT